MPEPNQQTEEMQSDPSRPKPVFHLLGLFFAFASIIISILNCIFLAMNGFNFLCLFIYVCIILPTSFISAVLIIVGDKKNEEGRKEYRLSEIFILLSVFVTGAFLFIALDDFNYWG